MSTLSSSPPPSPYLVAPADLAAACLSSPTPNACGATNTLSLSFVFFADPQLFVSANQPISVGAEVRHDAAALTGVFSWFLKTADASATELTSLPAGSSRVRLAMPYALDPTVTQLGGAAAPIAPPDPTQFGRACLRLVGPSSWALEQYDGESGGYAYCLTENTGEFLVVTYPLSSSSGGGSGGGGSGGGGGGSSTPTPTPTATPAATPAPTPTFPIGGPIPPFGTARNTPQVAFYILFDGFASGNAFEVAGGKQMLEDDIRAFFSSPAPSTPTSLVRQVQVGSVATGTPSGRGAVVGAAVEFVSGAQGVAAASLLQSTLLTQPWLVFSPSFYGTATALSATAYNAPIAIPNGGTKGSGEKPNAGAIAGGVVGGLAALALAALLARRVVVRHRRDRAAAAAIAGEASLSPGPDNNSSSNGNNQPQQFIANSAADPSRPVASVASPLPSSTSSLSQQQQQPLQLQQEQSSSPSSSAAGSAFGSGTTGLSAPLVG